MTTTETTEGRHPHEKCACSRNRQCALHRYQMRDLTKKVQAEARERRRQETVAEGIERLRRMHGGIR